jgi:pilus assembly protein CpaF
VDGRPEDVVVSLSHHLQQARVQRAQPTVRRGPLDGDATDPLASLKHRTQEALLRRLGARLYDPALSDDRLNAFVQEELASLVEETGAPLSAAERHRLVGDISGTILGYGPLQPHLADPEVTEIMVTGSQSIHVERAGRIQRTDTRFLSDEHLRRVIERIVGQVGRRIDESSPMVDARLPDGSRVNAVIPPISVRGPALTIRKFAHDPFTAEDLVALGTMTAELWHFLACSIEGRRNVLISGGTGTGKTTLLNVLSSAIPVDERIVTIEDAVELQLHQEHVVTLESRPPNIEHRGEITIRDLVRNALRMRPDRIIVGEVRGGETLDMLQAMNTGHEGSLSTVHANAPRDALARIETMVLMAGMDLPLHAVREQAASALDLIVHLVRLPDGSRRIAQVTEVTGMEGEVVTLQDLFVLDVAHARDASGRVVGVQEPTGIRPSYLEELRDLGLEIPAETFGDEQALVDAHLDRGGGRRRR